MSGAGDERQRRVEAGLWTEPIAHPRRAEATAIEQAMVQYRVPGCSVAVIAGGEVAWEAGYGVTEADLTDATPVGTDTIFQACSISKAVAAVAALRLVAAGRLDLDEDVNAYLTSWRVPPSGDWRPRVTLRQLLSHTAGLTYCWYPGYFPGTPVPTAVQTLRGESPANTPSVRATTIPGTQFRYSGSHYTVVQQLLADVTGQPFAALARELVFAPLGMVSSGYETDFPARHAGAAAAGHDAGGAPIAGGWRIMPESAGAGLWTTPGDLCRLVADLLAAWSGVAGHLLDPAMARAMLTPQIGGWGLGWTIGGVGGVRCFGHGGSNIGYKCRVVAWPGRGVGAAVMTNGDEGGALIGEIVAAVGREYGWPDATGAEDSLGDVPGATALAAFAGRYGGGDGRPFIWIATDGVRLHLHAEGQPPLPLRAVGGSAFIADALDAEITFAPGSHGSARALTLRQHGDALTLDRAGAGDVAAPPVADTGSGRDSSVTYYWSGGRWMNSSQAPVRRSGPSGRSTIR